MLPRSNQQLFLDDLELGQLPLGHEQIVDLLPSEPCDLVGQSLLSLLHHPLSFVKLIFDQFQLSRVNGRTS